MFANCYVEHRIVWHTPSDIEDDVNSTFFVFFLFAEFGPLWEHNAKQEHSIQGLVVKLIYSNVVNDDWVVLLF